MSLDALNLSMRPARRIGALAVAAGWVFALSLGATAFPLQAKKTTHEKPYWDDTIIPGSPVTVLELARRIIPDIKSDPDKVDKVTGRDFSRVRVVDGVEETGMELDTDSDEEREISEADYFWMKDDRDRRLVLLLKVDVERPVIGLFKVSPEVALLDAVTIAQDAHVDVETGKLWAIHPRREAFAVQCWHDNSSESFDGYTFISIVNHKLRAVAGQLVFSGFTTYLPARRRLCKTATTPKFQFVRSPGRAYFDLIVTDLILKVCHPEAEEWSWKTGIVFQKNVRTVWRWNAKKRQYGRASARR